MCDCVRVFADPVTNKIVPRYMPLMVLCIQYYHSVWYVVTSYLLFFVFFSPLMYHYNFLDSHIIKTVWHTKCIFKFWWCTCAFFGLDTDLGAYYFFGTAITGIYFVLCVVCYLIMFIFHLDYIATMLPWTNFCWTLPVPCWYQDCLLTPGLPVVCYKDEQKQKRQKT